MDGTPTKSASSAYISVYLEVFFYFEGKVYPVFMNFNSIVEYLMIILQFLVLQNCERSDE